MTQSQIFPGAAALPAIRADLDRLHASDNRFATMSCLIIQAGGTCLDDSHGAALIEVSLHGICGHGTTAEEAIAAWMKHAARALQADESALWYARAALADHAHHDDAALHSACLIIEDRSDNPHEITNARAMRVLIEGEAA